MLKDVVPTGCTWALSTHKELYQTRTSTHIVDFTTSHLCRIMAGDAFIEVFNYLLASDRHHQLFSPLSPSLVLFHSFLISRSLSFFLHLSFSFILSPSLVLFHSFSISRSLSFFLHLSLYTAFSLVLFLHLCHFCLQFNLQLFSPSSFLPPLYLFSLVKSIIDCNPKPLPQLQQSSKLYSGLKTTYMFYNAFQLSTKAIYNYSPMRKETYSILVISNIGKACKSLNKFIVDLLL